MALYYSKEGLYRQVANFKIFLGFASNDYKIDLVQFCLESGVLLSAVPFSNPALRGMAALEKCDEGDVIILNSNRSMEEQNFDCGHEMIHLGFHRHENKMSFNCLDNVKMVQNSFLEWHANEGAAEFLVPYKVLLPIIKHNYNKLTSSSSICQFREFLASVFLVTSAVIKYRFESLKYEIVQYLNGVPLDSLQIISATKQKDIGINAMSLNDLDNSFFKEEKKEKLVDVLELFARTKKECAFSPELSF